MESSIHLRQLSSEDWEVLRSIRLEALETHPDLFCPSTDERKRSPEEWKTFLHNEDMCIFALFDAERVIGVTGITKDRDDPSGKTALLVMSYINKAYRGKGLSKLFYEARIGWAKEQKKFDVITVGHREGNLASERANQAFGFELISKDDISWPDGSTAAFVKYELRL